MLATSPVHCETDLAMEPSRPLTLEGATTYCPQAALRRIANRLNTTVPNLETINVKGSARILYNAILMYSALEDNPCEVPLMVRSLDEHATESRADNIRKMARYNRRRGTISAGTGMRSREAPIPNLELGTAECQVQWPPKDWERKEDAKIKYEESFNIDIVHYTVGEGHKTLLGMQTLKEIMLVSNRRSFLLVFTYEILQWWHELQQRKMIGQAFRFYRYNVRHRKGAWELEGTRQGRKSESIILQAGQIEDILDDVRSFLSPPTRKFYRDHDLPYRKSYLLYGPPGTGKTSTIRMIAGYFGLNCCYLSVANKEFSNQLLGDALRKIPSNALIILEDIDALFKGRENVQSNDLTFSGVLNALDGLLSADGALLVMTTNHLEKLDPAMIRSGRVDRMFKFDLPDDFQLIQLLKSFYPGCTDESAAKFLEKVRARKEKQASSVPTLQQFFVEKRGKGAEESIEELEDFFESHFPEKQEK